MTVDQAIQTALQHHQAGRLQQAEQMYRQILHQQPDHADALHLMGLLASHCGQLGSAVEWIAKAIKANPDAAVYHSNLSEVLRKLGLLEEAEIASRRAVRLGPALAPAHANLGVVLYDRKQWRQAQQSFQRAIELDANLEAALAVLLAYALVQLNELDRAEQLARRRISETPNDAAAHQCLATVLESQQKLSEAQAEYRRAIELDPRHVEAMRSLGLLVRRKGNLIEAMDWWKRALVIQPDHPDCNWNLALGLLATGDFERGWPLFETRFRSEQTRHLLRNDPKPRWWGFDISGKTILLYGEQGFGDVIQFSRFIPDVAAHGARVIVQAAPELSRLMSGIKGVSQVLARDPALPEYDVHQTLLSLPLVLRTTLKTLPADVPYIQVDPRQRQQWAQRIGAQAGKLKVGLVWAGRKTHADDPNRSISAESLKPLADVQGVQFFSLQKNVAALPFEMIDLGKDLTDFSETAAAVANLDLVIGIDSAVVHLAGALGTKVWTLLPLAPDWRWMLDREDSPWYPTMRLFRQRALGDWPQVIRRVRDELIKSSESLG